MNRWFLVFTGCAVVVLILLIWFDSQTRQGSDDAQITSSEPLHVDRHHTEFSQTDEVYTDFHGDVDMSDPESINRRISEIELRLQQTDPMARDAVPFYGELMMLYQQLGREDGASEASRHIAMILEDPEDWWNAALLSYRWAQRVQDTESQQYYMDRAEQNFAEAVQLSGNPELHTDYAVVLFARNKHDSALNILEAVIDREEATYRTYLYAGMILYKGEKKDESISYINKSVQKAETQAERETIEAVTAGTTIEI